MVKKNFTESEDKYFVRAFDYKVGDIVQIKPDGYCHSGKIGIVIGIRLHYKKKNALAYELLLPNNKTFVTDCKRIRLLRAAGNDSNET
ncbi:MAG: hypothetical protein IKF58_16605, partial [Bacillus sp. (in: Bacteria)]|nr:hypothetical protein [Bacillus sp. (in: firmicutes)]